MEELNPVAHEIYIEVQQALFKETRMLREERWREWLETMVEKDIVYRAIVSQLRWFQLQSIRSHLCFLKL